MSELRVHDITLTGERVVLRPMTERDWPLIEAINNDPEVGYFSEEDEWTPYTREKLQRIYRSTSQNALMFVVEHQGQPVGECWLQRMNDQRILDEFAGQDGVRGPFRLVRSQAVDHYLGSYELHAGRLVSVSRFGDLGVLTSVDTGSCRVRALFPASEQAFVISRGFLTPLPIWVTLTFVRATQIDAPHLLWEEQGSSARSAPAVPFGGEDVTFRNGDVTLAATRNAASTDTRCRGHRPDPCAAPLTYSPGFRLGE